MADFDTIIIGAGHNGLVCATYLAKAGQTVLLLEAADEVGGLAQTFEFHPGFKTAVAHTISHFSPIVAKELNLAAHGLRFQDPLPTVGLVESGEHITIQDHSVSGVDTEETKTFFAHIEKMRRFAAVMDKAWHKTMPRIGNNNVGELLTFAGVALKLRLLGREEMGEFLRVASLPARDLMDETFENETLKAMLSWDGLTGNKMAPRSPNSTVLNMWYRMSEGGGDHGLPEGGFDALVTALKLAAEDAGVEIKTGARVKNITIEGSESGLQATGVVLEGGETFSADHIISAADPKRTFIDLVGVQNLEIEFTNRIQRLRGEGLVAKFHLALSDLPEIEGVENHEGRFLITPEMDALEFSFDNAKYGELPETPVMEFIFSSVFDPDLAPPGQHVLSAHVMYVPYDLKDGWNDKARADLEERVIETLAKYAPGIRDLIIDQQLLTPKDLEEKFHVTGGHWSHGDFAMDQILMMRPTYEAAQYATPIPGLYLCGAGSHPGGDITGIPGHNAAKEILK